VDAATPALIPTAETGVARLLGRHPATARVFLAHRMACVGCSLAAFETLADAAREYRLPLADFLAELEHAARTPSDPTDRPTRRDLS
jgi:hybrid cluster-associated redox disulfide protein